MNEKEKVNQITDGVIWKQLLLFFFPIVFGTFFQQIYNTADTIVVGRFVGKQALAAVGGSASQIANLIVGFFVGLSSGAAVVISQFYGAKDKKNLSKALHTAFAFSIAAGIVLTVVGIFLTRPALLLMKTPADVVEDSAVYLHIYFGGMVFNLVYNMGAAILRAVGDSKRPLYFLIASCITNIVLDIVFVIFFHWGVAGVAIATTIAQVVSALLTLRVLSSTTDSYAFHLSKLTFDSKVLLHIIEIGFPVGIQSCLYCVANLFIQTSVNGYGTDTVAAYTAFGKIDALFWNTSGALGQAVLTFCGQNFGAGKIDRVKKGIHIGTIMYFIGAATISLICYFGGSILYHLFTQDQEVIRIGMEILQFICPLWATFCFVEILSSSIRACGDSFIPTVITALCIGAFRICWIIFYPAKTLFDTLICFPISWVMTSALFLIYYLQGSWLKKSLKQREKLFQEKN